MDSILNALLSQLGLGLATNAVYDFLKGFAGQETSRQKLQVEIQNRIDLHGVSMSAETVIDALASNGVLQIRQSSLHGNQSLVFGSKGGTASFGDNSVLSTSRTAIQTGSGAFMNTHGNAQVRQNSDGSITFHIG